MTLSLPVTQRSRFAPRYYQREAKEAVLEAWDAGSAEAGHPLLVMATGTGKTFTALHILEEAIDAGERIVWLAHREELLLQALKSLQVACPGVRGGIVQANRNETTAQVVFASVDTLRTDRRLEDILRDGHPAVVVVDEAHHSPSPTHQNAIQALVQPGTRMLGLTATADREDGADLADDWQIVYSYDIVQAVADGFLAPPYAVHVPIELDLEGINQNDDAELGAALIRQGIVEATVEAMQASHLCQRLPERDDQRFLDPTGRSALVFTATVEQARLTAEALREAGIVARYVSGETPKGERRALLRAFEQGRIQVLCNPSVLTEGTDLPRASLGVLARPLRSWSLYVQCAGRVLRLFDGKDEGMLLDLAGATKLHSLAAAPVLIGGSKCKKSPNGVHSYVLDGDGPKGVCEHCKHEVACFETLGGHDWIDRDGKRMCRHCESPQCKGSEDGRHHWVPYEDASRICIDCDVEIPDPHVGMLKRKSPDELAKADDLWFRVTEVEPETWAIDVEEHGMLFMVGDRSVGQWDAYWLKKRARKPRRLSSKPIPRDLVRTYADDIVRRARRRPGGRPVTSKQAEYAQQLGVETKNIRDAAVMAREISRAKARDRVIKLGLAQRVTS